MQINKTDENLKAFIELCEKFQPYDERYKDLTQTDQVFNSSLVEVAYLVYILLLHNDEDSNVKKAYNAWRKHYHGDSRRIHVLFNFVDMLISDEVTWIWEIRLDARNRNIEKAYELICRIFILWGLTAQRSFNYSRKDHAKA